MKHITTFRLLIGALLATMVVSVSAQTADPKARLQIAEKMFAERCKKAGEFIYRTAENVDGVLLMKLRPKEINRGDQYRMDDPYGSGIGGDGYIANFLRGKNASGSLVDVGAFRNGYHYVEAIDSQDGKRYRYTGSVEEVIKTSSPLIGGNGSTFKVKEFTLGRILATGPASRYGVTYDDISTREERDYWIAGSSLKVIDLQTNEVMAERIGYMMDRGQGNTSGGRAPWLQAERSACPAFLKTPGGQPFTMRESRDFVEKVLQIKQNAVGE